jgi:hypothetical protein
MKPTIRFVFTEAYMGSQHKGLKRIMDEYAEKNAIFARVIKQEGALCLFINAKKTACKLYGGGHVLAYFKSEHPLTVATISSIPESFGGSIEIATAARNSFKRLFIIEKITKAA